ncbi:MAG TPA: hypothetical protein VFX96_09345 [Pyrinomonadaceae bacterium]|nr:hypothetical protein [Pyrinomonadaceae bacterium]
MRASLNNVPRRLVRFVVLGAAALSLLPATSAPARAQDGGAAASSSAPAASPQKINAQPLRQLLVKFKQILERKESSGETGEARVEADISEDGSLSNVWVGGTADKDFLQFADETARALNDSRALSVFAKDARHVNLRLHLGPEHVEAFAALDVNSAERANELALGYGGMLLVARRRAAERPTLPLWNSVRLSANGKQLVMRLEMPREQAGNLLLQRITPN